MIRQDDLFRKGVTVNDMQKIQESMNEAYKDDTPFAVVTKDSVNVVGDVNKTEVKHKDYVVEFHFTPDELEKYHIAKEDIKGWTQGQAMVDIEFSDVTLKPRYDIEVNAAMVHILPYFFALREDGKTIEQRSETEIVNMVNDMSIQIGDDMYNLVAAFLQIDRSIVNNMEWVSVANTINAIIRDFPEVFKEAESTFPASADR